MRSRVTASCSLLLESHDSERRVSIAAVLLNDAPLAAAALREQLLDFPRARLYAVMDMARGEAVRQLVQESGADRRRLTSGGLPEAINDLLPVLVAADPGSGMLERFLEQGWGEGWGILVSSPLELEPLRNQLRLQLIHEEEGHHFLLRFYDPAVVRRELEAGTPGRLAGVLAQVGCLAAETPDEPGAWLHLLKGGALRRLQLRWEASRQVVIPAQEEAALEEALRSAQEAARAARERGAALAHLEARRIEVLASLRESLRANDERRAELEAEEAAASRELESLPEERERPDDGQEALRCEDQQLERRMLALAEVMTRDAMAGVAAYNRLKARGTRLAGKLGRLNKELDAAHTEQAAEVEQLEADLALVKQGIQEQRREMEQHKDAAGEHQQLEQRRAEVRAELTRMTEAEDEAAAHAARLARRRDELLDHQRRLEQRRVALVRTLEPDPAIEAQYSGLRQALSRLAGRREEAADSVERAAAREAGLDQAREQFNRAVVRFNFAQRLVLGKREQAARTGEDPTEAYHARHGELLHLCQAYRANRADALAACEQLVAEAGTLEDEAARAAPTLARDLEQLTETLTLEEQP